MEPPVPLLKCLAGIYRTDEGRIYAKGRVSTSIVHSVGSNPELAARDDLILNEIMLGLSPREADERFESPLALGIAEKL